MLRNNSSDIIEKLSGIIPATTSQRNERELFLQHHRECSGITLLLENCSDLLSVFSDFSVRNLRKQLPLLSVTRRGGGGERMHGM